MALLINLNFYIIVTLFVGIWKWGQAQNKANCPTEVEIITNSPVCEGVTLRLSTSWKGQASWLWQGPNQFLSKEPRAAKYATTLKDGGIYTLVLQIPGCPSLEKKFEVEIRPFPTKPSIPAFQNLCTGDTLFLPVEPLPRATYEWRGPNNFVSREASLYKPDVTSNDAGLYQLVVMQNGCISKPSSLRLVVNNRPPLPEIQHNAPICEGETLLLSTPAIAGVSYEWKGPEGFYSHARTIQMPAFLKHAGEYSLRLHKNGCFSQVNKKKIEVLPLPGEVRIIGPDTLCGNSTLELIATAQRQEVKFFWKGPFNFSYVGPSFKKVLSIYRETEEVYEVVGAIGSCSTQAVTKKLKFLPPPLPVIVTSNSPICSGQALHFTTIALERNIFYYWKGPNNYTSPEPNPTIEKASNLQNGTYSLVVRNNFCSSLPITVLVQVNTFPSLTNVFTNSPVCEKETLKLSVEVNLGVEYYWQGPNHWQYFGAAAEIPNVAKENSGWYRLTAQHRGCKTDTLIKVIVKSQPIVGFIPISASVCLGESLKIDVPLIEGAYYLWQGPAGFAHKEPELKISKVNYHNAGDYLLKVVVEGCTSEVQNVEVKVLDCRKQCLPPEDISVQETTASRALVRFSPRSSEAKSYIIAYGPLWRNPERWETKVISALEPAVVLEDLQPATRYGFRIRSNCTLLSRASGDRSYWSNSISFLTPESEAVYKIQKKLANASCVVYPNPFYGVLKITFASFWQGQTLITFYDGEGKSKFQTLAFIHAANPLVELQLTSLENGFYTLEIKKEDTALRLMLVKN
ncbi:MAG: fibronectin type III domain-containing protein [Bacteroidia bacterium]|nr:fibronectin type III domain-containing protein [Bacteroidia bacterium]